MCRKLPIAGYADAALRVNSLLAMRGMRVTTVHCILCLSALSSGLQAKVHASINALAWSPLKKQHIKSRSFELHSQYRLRMAAQKAPKRTVIYACDSRREEMRCGGLGDRFKGFVSSFVLAMLLDADFRACWDWPVRTIVAVPGSGMKVCLFVLGGVAQDCLRQEHNSLDVIVRHARFLKSWFATQVPLQHCFTIADDVLVTSADLQSRESNASLIDFFQAHTNASELARLRATNFEMLLGSNSTLLMRCNGAIWCEGCSCLC